MLFRLQGLTLLMIVIMAVCLELNQKAEIPSKQQQQQENKQTFSMFGEGSAAGQRATSFSSFYYVY